MKEAKQRGPGCGGELLSWVVAGNEDKPQECVTGPCSRDAVLGLVFWKANRELKGRPRCSSLERREGYFGWV